MSKCPYTYFRNFFQKKSSDNKASNLRVLVQRNNENVVDVSLPAHSARWLIELIPDDVISKIYAEGIPLKEIQDNLAKQEILYATDIFKLEEQDRKIIVWLQ